MTMAVAGVRHRAADDAFFDAGFELAAAAVQWSAPVAGPPAAAEEEDCAAAAFVCALGGCSAQFRTATGYEDHYATCHRHKCSVCGAFYPTGFLLSIHLDEAHGSFFAAAAARPGSAMYRCLVEGCPAAFAGPELRQAHLAEDHCFPRTYRFAAPPRPGRRRAGAGGAAAAGRGGRGPGRGRQRPRGGRATGGGGAAAAMEVDDAAVDALCGEVDSLKLMVPRGVSFGRRGRNHRKLRTSGRDPG